VLPNGKKETRTAVMDEQEKQRIIADTEARLEAKRKRELSDKMRAMGRKRTAKKIAAGRRNIKLALATRWGKTIDGVKPKGK
jgi:hypothetical protein